MSVQKEYDQSGKVKGWYWVIEAGNDSGKRKRYKKRGFKTKKAAEEAEAVARVQIANGTYVEASSETVAQLLERWLTTVARHNVRPTTYEDYEGTIRIHLVPYLGNIKVQKLTPGRLQTFYSERIDAGVGTRSLQLAHRRLSQALDMAVRESIVSRNVCQIVGSPKHKPRTGQSWTEEEAIRFLETAEKHRLHPLWALELATGLRRGELLGLRWQDVDLDAGTIHIRQAISILKGAPIVTEPKTPAARRKIGLPPDVAEAMREHRKAWVARRLAASTWEGDLVFCTRDGKPLNPNNLYRDYNQLIAEAGVPRIRLHDARHTHGTLMSAAGVSIRAVADRLGHARTSVTLDTYSHVLPKMRDEATAAIDAALFQKRRKLDSRTNGTKMAPETHEEPGT
jgi:integrase